LNDLTNPLPWARPVVAACFSRKTTQRSVPLPRLCDVPTSDRHAKAKYYPRRSASSLTYIASTSDQTSCHCIDCSKLLVDIFTMSMTRLGVVARQNLDFRQSGPNVSSMDPDQALNGRTSR